MIQILCWLIWAGASVIVSQLVVGQIMVWTGGVQAISSPIGNALFLAFSYVLALFMVLYVPSHIGTSRKNTKKRRTSEQPGKKAETPARSSRLKEIGLSGWPTWTDVGLAPVEFIVYFLFATGAIALFSLFPWFDVSQAQDIGFGYYLNGAERFFAFLLLVVVAPFAEEVIFRGWLYNKLRSKTSTSMSTLASIVISSLLVSVGFGVIHWQWNVGIDVFVLSMIACLAREITGTIYAGIFLHMLKNGLAFFLLYVRLW